MKTGFERVRSDLWVIKMLPDRHRQIKQPHQSAAGHTGNQLGSLAAEDESSQIKEHTHHRQQDKHIDLEMEAWGGRGEMDHCGWSTKTVKQSTAVMSSMRGRGLSGHPHTHTHAQTTHTAIGTFETDHFHL